MWTLLLEAALPGELVRATSALHPSVWWHGITGERYMALNRAKIESGVHTERVFVYEDDDEYEAKVLPGLIQQNLAAKVHVHKISWKRAFTTQDFLIIGDRYAASLDVRERRYAMGYQLVTAERELDLRTCKAEFDRLFMQPGVTCCNTAKPGASYDCRLEFERTRAAPDR
jgi:hypothetical protein